MGSFKSLRWSTVIARLPLVSLQNPRVVEDYAPAKYLVFSRKQVKQALGGNARNKKCG